MMSSKITDLFMHDFSGSKTLMINIFKNALYSCAALSLAGLPVSIAAPATVDSSDLATEAPSMIALSTGKGMAIRLPRAAKNVFVADSKIANVNAASNRLVYVYGAADGETTLYAVDAQDHVIYSATVRVGTNITQLQQMLKVAMPGSTIDVKTMNGMVFISGFVGSPKELEEAGRLTQQLVGEKQIVVNRLQTQTPVQVYLQVRFAEVDRGLVKQISTNWQTKDTTNGFQFGLFGTRNFLTQPTIEQIPVFNPVTGAQLYNLTGPAAGTLQTVSRVKTAGIFNLADTGAYSALLKGNLLGLAIDSAVDALEKEGMVSVLAEPTLVALSGEKASFLAGGEFPIPISETNGQLSIAFKQYGVGLEFTPVVQAGNRISMRVRPEVSQITDVGSIKTATISIPGLQTRRAETVVEMGSGESFVIAGLLQNTTRSDISKLPGVGNLPILGALFKSDRFERQETELVIVVTPYLVKPVKPDQVHLPTDGLQAPNDLQRYLLGQTFRQGFHPKSPGGPNATVAAVNTATSADNSTAVHPGFSFGK